MPDRFANGDQANHDLPFTRGMNDCTKSRYYHGGDFRGIIEHRPYLKDLGLTALWLMPIYDNVNHLNEREKYDDSTITDYYGDEIGMTGGDDPDNRRDSPGGWNEDSSNAFEASGRDEVRQDLFQSIRKLAHLRAATPALRHGTLVDSLVEDDAYAFARVAGGSRALVVFNQAEAPANLHIPLEGIGIQSAARLESLLGTTPPVKSGRAP